MKKVIVSMVSIMAAGMLIAAICNANEMVSGVTKSFDAKVGRLVMQTASQGEATFSVPQSVKVLLRVRGKDTEIADAWNFLENNLRKGTKVQVLQAGGSVLTIWILEVPR